MKAMQNIKEKVTLLDQRITWIKEYQEKSSKVGDPMDISSAPRSEANSSDAKTEEEEEGFEDKGGQEEEEGAEEEGGQEEEERTEEEGGQEEEEDH
ncbi:uncharacterized protein LOC131168374 [Malania oleifera]|uniref:uncharacterized protein LOC131168374 n=1 Tax=Malania oleifera TaxID=397392 RepID=UPI0025ADBF45|nr:uncharacterized protein LOC131168374 [Malania oleifera]